MGDWFMNILVSVTIILIIYAICTGSVEIQAENMLAIPAVLIGGVVLFGLLNGDFDNK